MGTEKSTRNVLAPRLRISGLLGRLAGVDTGIRFVLRISITSAANYLGSKYLSECALFVTLEPCVMCAGALHWVQLQKLVFGATDVQRGYSLSKSPLLHPKTEVVKGVKAVDSKELLDKFFKRIRE